MTDRNERRKEARERLRQTLEQPEEKISLAEAALWIAASEYPELDPAQYIGRLDRMADTVAQRIAGQTDPLAIIGVINQYLFQEEGFCGNTEDYYDPRNSFLNEVLDRKTGIPITLSTIYMEVAGRLQFPLVGVGMPGHFLVKHPYFAIILDPFAGGSILSEDDCRAQMQRVLGESVPFDRSYLEGVSKRHILVRMLNNLRSIFVNAREFLKALEMTELALIVQPDSPEESKQKAAILLHLKRYSEAMSELSRYLEQAPAAEDAQQVQQALANLRKTMAQWN